ncbi:MAG: amidohydrolase family protein [Planctomycetes bacterium]|nr:amidohydrolase family protein [Planctomycetota bacterium]
MRHVPTALAGAAGLLLAIQATARDRPGAPPGPLEGPPVPLALVGATVHVDARTVVEGATVTLRGGLVEATGPDLASPPDAAVVDCAGLHVYPGFIDAHTGLGLAADAPEAREVAAAQGEVPDFHRGALAATREAHRRGLRPTRDAGAEAVPSAEECERLRRAGFAVALSAPGGAIVAGRGALLALGGRPRRESVIAGPSSWHLSLELPGEDAYPETLMGRMAHLRQFLLDASAHHGRLRAWRAEPRGRPRPPDDPDLEAALGVRESGLPVVFEVRRENDVRRALALAEELGLRPILSGADEAWRVADLLAERRVPVVLALDFPEEPRLEPPPGTDPGDPGLVPQRVRQDRHRRWEERVAGAARLREAGVELAFSTRGMEGPGESLAKLRLLLARGLPVEDAVEALTAAPARLFGAGEVLGKVEAGRAACLTLLDGPLETESSRVRRVVVDGRLFDLEEDRPERPPEVDLSGTWEVEVELPDGRVAWTLVLEQDGSRLSGSATSSLGEATLTRGLVSGRSVHLWLEVRAGGETLEVELTGEAREGRIEGTATGRGTTARWSARKPEAL